MPTYHERRGIQVYRAGDRVIDTITGWYARVVGDCCPTLYVPTNELVIEYYQFKECPRIVRPRSVLRPLRRHE